MNLDLDVVLLKLSFQMIQFEELYEELPRKVQAWSIDDVEKWLVLNSLNSLVSSFRELGVDGKKMKNMTQETIFKEMTIKSRQILKMLVAWVEEQRQLYDEYVIQREKATDKLQIQPIAVLQEIKINKEPRYEMKPALKITLQSKAKEYLIFETAKIGRLQTNNIIIDEDAVSRTHATINKNNCLFYIKDHSKFGTFVENGHKIELSQGAVFLLGKSEFTVKNLNVSRIYFDITISYIIKEETLEKFVGRSMITIGTKSKDLQYLYDEEIKDQHAVIKLQDGRIWLEAKHGSTYSRLKLQTSYKISNSRFKLGNSALKIEPVWGCQRCQKSIPFVYQVRQDCIGCQFKK